MKSIKTKSMLLLSSIFLVACSNNDTEDVNEAAASNEANDNEVVEAAEYENAHLLVDVDWVDENIDDIILVDVRGEEYESAHIPGAVQLEAGRLSDPNNPIDGVIPDEESFQEIVRSVGINDDSTVVAYDDGDSLWATRLFYGLELYGHEDVRVLDGGFTAWLSDGKDVSADAPSIEEGDFTAELNSDLELSQEEVEAEIDNEGSVLLDARSEGEYDGTDVRAERGGHIPSAVHLAWTDGVYDDGVPYFKDKEELEEQFAAVGADRDKTIVPYCQTNVRGAHSYFQLRLLGYENIHPYEGSWAEWGNDPDAEIES